VDVERILRKDPLPGVPDLDAELACASDAEARLQTGANPTALEGTPSGRGLYHDRVVRVVGRARTCFELGVRRDQPPLAVYANGDVLLSGSPYA
jgi:hypothetical protein